MNKSAASRRHYDKRVKDVEQYIHDHLDEAIDLNRLAEVACLSPYHWHRVYHSIQGETVHATLSRLRLQRAAWLLLNSDLSLKQISRRAGYSAAPPFSRAFKAAYGISPIQYRTSGPQIAYQAEPGASLSDSLEVVVREQPEYRCVALAHKGKYIEADRAFSALMRNLVMQNAMSDQVKTIGVYFDDPSLIEESQLESLACASGVAADFEQGELEDWTIPGGLHAVLHHRGPYDVLEYAYHWLFGCWLPDSDYEPADDPVYEIYVNNPRDTAPKDLLVDICLPLSPRAQPKSDDD